MTLQHIMQPVIICFLKVEGCVKLPWAPLCLFIKRFSPPWQSLAQTDSLGFDRELKQVHTRRGSSTAAICLREQRVVKYSAHLHRTLSYSFVWVSYRTMTYHEFPGIHFFYLSGLPLCFLRVKRTCDSVKLWLHEALTWPFIPTVSC